MQLDFAQIKSITQGAASVEYSDGKYTFHRFHTLEEDLYAPTQFRDKVYSTAGVQMEFLTDATELFLDIETSTATSRTYFSVDIFVNGALWDRMQNFDDTIFEENYTEMNFPLGRYTKEISLGEGEKRVRIVFPWSTKTQLLEMQAKNATYIKPCPKDKALIMYGDSITNGYDAVYTSNSYAVRLADALDAELFNKGIGGEIFFPALATVKSHPSPALIIVAYGTNDWSKTEKADAQQRCKAFYANLVANYPSTNIVALTPVWRKNHSKIQKFGEFSHVAEMIKEICAEYPNIKVISGWELIPHDEMYYADRRVHPNDQGFDWYYRNLKEKIDTERVF